MADVDSAVGQDGHDPIGFAPVVRTRVSLRTLALDPGLGGDRQAQWRPIGSFVCFQLFPEKSGVGFEVASHQAKFHSC